MRASSSNNIGLPIDESSHGHDDDNAVTNTSSNNENLASLAAKRELQKKLESLKSQLNAATDALERLESSSKEKKNGTTKTKKDKKFIPSPLADRTSTPVRPPAGKRGYLFKWMDRSIGWGGTKWALRFVSLNNGRLSYYGSHTETAPRYVLNLRGCAVREEGLKRNRRHRSSTTKRGLDPPIEETGAYFFLFSIYQRKGPYDESDDVIPLLRFSTPSMAEKNQWVQLLSEACAYCETEEFQSDEALRTEELLLQQQQAASMTKAMPEAKDGTLPPLYFAPAFKPLQRRPSTNKMPDAKLFLSKSKNTDAEKVESRSKKGYPPSRPMHRCAAASYLSSESPPQSYRGLFNLGIIILVVSNFRLMLATIKRHGFVVTDFLSKTKEIHEIRHDPWNQFPLHSGFLTQFLFITIAFWIEFLLSRKKLSETVGMILHLINSHCALAAPVAIVWNLIDNPVTGAILLLHGSITWMKLISYAHANEDYRMSSKLKAEEDSHKASLALIGDLDLEDTHIIYPQNVTMGNMLYFWFAPTLTYQIAFPRYPRVRLWKIVRIILQMVVVFTLFTFLVAQVVNPAIESLVVDLEETNGTITAGIMADYWLRLSIVNSYLWLLMFYFYFHLYLNLFAEILRFGDRIFYKDWWNSSEVSAYWRLWNMPVHYWLIRHVYFPCLRMKTSRTMATFVVFFLSAVMHELLVSVPFHMIRPWSFIGMMLQMPLVGITKLLNRKYPGSSIGNIIFWISFCVVGQPMAILLYTIDYEYAKHNAVLEISKIDECRIRFGDRCLIR